MDRPDPALDRGARALGSLSERVRIDHLGQIWLLDGTCAATLVFAPPLGSANISLFVSAVTLDLGAPRIGSITPPAAIDIF